MRASSLYIAAAGTFTVKVSRDSVAGSLEIADAGTTIAIGVPGSTAFSTLTVGDVGGLGANAGAIDVIDRNTLLLLDTDPGGLLFTNSGTIALQSSGDMTQLEIGGDVILTGGGQVTLGGNTADAIVSDGAAATLANAGNIISGGGTIGDANLTLVNSGVIDATVKSGLVIATGANAVANSGTLEASDSSLTISNAVVNSGGSFAASGGGIVRALGAVSGTGSAAVAGGTLEFGASVGAGEAVTLFRHAKHAAARSRLNTGLRRHCRRPRRDGRDRFPGRQLHCRQEHADGDPEPSRYAIRRHPAVERRHTQHVGRAARAIFEPIRHRNVWHELVQRLRPLERPFRRDVWRARCLSFLASWAGSTTKAHSGLLNRPPKSASAA